MNDETVIRMVYPHGSWREVYAALEVNPSVEPTE